MRPDWRREITITRVEQARHRITEMVVRSPLVLSPGLLEVVGVDASLKVEGVQPAGSFKVRGAAAKILALADDEAGRGVVTASTGNHGRAVAYVAARAGTPAAICLSENVPIGKVEALRTLGCEVIVSGNSQTAALAMADRLVAERGMTLVHPFDDPDVIAGQGTLGLEVAEDAPDTNTVLVPLSGGGLLSGVALAVKSHLPAAKIVGISMERGAVMAASLAAGHPVDLPEEPTLADSLQGGIGRSNRFTFSMVRDLMDQLVLVNEEEIWNGMQWAFRHHGLVLEGGGAVGIAALLAGKLDVTGPIVVVCSGRNLEIDQLLALGSPAGRPVEDL